VPRPAPSGGSDRSSGDDEGNQAEGGAYFPKECGEPTLSGSGPFVLFFPGSVRARVLGGVIDHVCHDNSSVVLTDRVWSILDRIFKE
jgi:hypothetical protein